MAKLAIRGTNKYIHRMFNHLRKEHPSTKKKMKATGYKPKRR